MAISQTITDIPTPPSSSDATNFRTRADAFMASLDTLSTELNTFGTQANALETNVNNKEASAVSASQAAVSSANFQGNWSSATDYVIGESVVYSGVIYRSLLNGTNKTPSSSPTYWIAVSVASSIANTPSGTISATDVQSAINELGTEKAPLASPAFTGTPTAPTPPAGDNSTRIATTAWVLSAMSNIASSAGFASSFGANGYIKLPSWLGGWMVQWVLKAGAGSNGNILLPIAFPTAALRTFSSYDQNVTTLANSVPSTSASTTSVNYYNASGGGLAIYAIGY